MEGIFLSLKRTKRNMFSKFSSSQCHCSMCYNIRRITYLWNGWRDCPNLVNEKFNSLLLVCFYSFFHVMQAIDTHDFLLLEFSYCISVLIINYHSHTTHEGYWNQQAVRVVSLHARDRGTTGGPAEGLLWACPSESSQPVRWTGTGTSHRGSGPDWSQWLEAQYSSQGLNISCLPIMVGFLCSACEIQRPFVCICHIILNAHILSSMSLMKDFMYFYPFS